MNTTITNSGGAIGQPVKVLGNRNELMLMGTIAFDSSYATNGEAFDVTSYFPKGQVSQVIIPPTSGYLFEFIGSTNKIKVYEIPAHSHAVTFGGSTAAETAHTHTTTMGGSTAAPSATAAATVVNSVVLPGLATITASATKYLGTTGTEAASAAAAAAFVVPAAGTIGGMYAKLGTAPGSGKTYSLTVVKNGTDTGVTLSIAGTNTTGSDSSNTVAVTAGDLITLKSVADDGASALLSVSLTYTITSGTSALPTSTHTHASTGLTATTGAGSSHVHGSTGLTGSVASGGTVATEVTNATDLSALTAVPFIAYGY